jgi:hypothetical protein
MKTASAFDDSSEEDEIRRKVKETYSKKFAKSGLIIPDYVTYRTLLEYEKLRISNPNTMLSFESIRMQAVLSQLFAISILKRDEYEFVVKHDAELLEHYGIPRK